MTRRSPARLLSAVLFAVFLCSCSGHPSVDPAAASAEGQGAGARSNGGNPGAPGGDAGGAAGGGAAGGGTEVQAGGNPGAPGDVAVFEEAGAPYSALRDDAASKCAHGVCTLLAPVVTAGHPDDVGGLDACIIRKKSDIHYDPPAQNGLFRKGATVRADVVCTAGSSTDGTGGTTGSAGSTSDAPPSADQAGGAPSS